MCRRSVVIVALLVHLLLLPAPGQEQLRILTWNVQALGTPGSSEWNNAIAILQRLDADVVCIEEVTNLSEVADFPTFAAAAGYSYTALASASGTLTGNLRNGVLSRFPILGQTSHNSVSLSGDANANDISRDILEVQVQVPNAADPLAFFVVHYKSSSGSTNDFRRSIESIRLKQAVDAFRAAHVGAPWVVCGDFNEDIGDGPFGTSFSSLPGGLPSTYSLGSDISLPVVYDPFLLFTTNGGQIADASQEDSTNAVTRESSGRRLDYLIHGGAVSVLEDEVYNSARDNGIDDGLPGMFLVKAGSPLPAGSSLAAADHYAVAADIEIPSLSSLAWPGTPDDFLQSTGINGPWTSGPGEDLKQASGGDLFYLHYVSPNGSFDGGVPIVVGQLFTTGSPAPVGPLPGMHFDLANAFPIFDGYASPIGFQASIIPVFGNLHAWNLPGGLAGYSVMIQTVTYSNAAWNGFIVFSDGHVLEFI
ncbi:MAG: endonuclease/exonuclease/phosphatase family protein [Planctomycetes bacterium]|nr:endonuclease/exonuclease/phosphatase family protein [Planctomycetota bacterium]